MCTHTYTYNTQKSNISKISSSFIPSLSSRLTQYLLLVFSYHFVLVGMFQSTSMDVCKHWHWLLISGFSQPLSTSFDLTCIELEAWEVEGERKRERKERTEREMGEKKNLCYWCVWWECYFYGVILLSTSNWRFNDSSRWLQSFSPSYSYFFTCSLIRNEIVARNTKDLMENGLKNSRSGIRTDKRGEVRTSCKQVKARKKSR